MHKVLVIGGTGMLGRPVTFQLIKDGFEVRLLTTHLQKAERIFGARVEYAVGDVGDLTSLKAAMAGCQAVYINLKGGPTKEDYIRIEEDGAKNVYLAAKECEPGKIVQISEADVSEKTANHIISRVKFEAEKALINSGLTYVILKPSWFCESLPLFFQKDKAIFVGSGKACFHFLAAPDYARIVSRCFQSNLADNKILTIFGPEAMPIPEAMRRFLAIVHPNAKINHLPLWLAQFSAAVSFNKNLKMAVSLMAFFNKYDDSDVAVSPEEADHLFGRCAITVEEWSKRYKEAIDRSQAH